MARDKAEMQTRGSWGRWGMALGLGIFVAACNANPPGGNNPPVDDEVQYPESLLCPQPAGSDPRCGTPFDPGAALSESALADAMRTGLETWRYVGQRGACAGCHSQDAIELARVGYTDADLRRRALDHVTNEQATEIINLVRAVRQRYRMTRLLHPARFRPLQPGYEPWPEVTQGLEVTDSRAQSERDGAFMDHLVNERRLLWATGRVTTLAEARRAYDELHAIDLVRLRLGIPFDHLSEDGHHGNEHRSVFEWFPGIASTPTPAARAEFYRRVDAYLADPTEKNLWAYYDAVSSMTACEADLGGADLADYPRACQWMRLKYRSLQVFQHMLRRGTLRYPDVLVDVRDTAPGATIQGHLDTVIARNPIWEAGDFLRVQPLSRPPETACNGTNQPCTLLPPVVDATVRNDPTPEQARIRQSEVFQQSWFVMSWQRDPALLYESDNFATFIGDYLESVLLPYYDIHHAFIVAKTAVEKSAATAWRDAPGFREGTGRIASVRTFSFKQLRDNFSPPPANDRRRAVHERMFANFARMWIFLVEEDLRTRREIYDRNEVLYAVRFMRTWIPQLEGAEDPVINQRVLSIEALALEATELRSARNRQENPGTGLQPNGRWAEFATPYTGQ